MRKIVPMAVAAGMLAAGGGVFGAWTATAKTIDLSVDGVPSRVTTHDATVNDVLDARGVTVGPSDQVAPSGDTKVRNGTVIDVRYSRDVTVNLPDGEQRRIATTALTIGDLMDQMNFHEQSRVSASRSTPIGREGLTVDVAPARAVSLSVGGKPAAQVVTAGRTVSDVLADAKVKYDKDDEVRPAKTAKVDELDDKGIVVNQVDFKETKKRTPIDYETDYRKSSELDVGKTEVQTEGRKGSKVETTREKFVNGKSVEKKVTDTKVEKKPVNKIVLRGADSGSGSGSGHSNSGSRSDSDTRSDSSKSDSDNSGSQSPASQNTCKASYYWQGQMTANGEQFNTNAMTAAHKSLPFNTRVKVTNPANGKTTVVRINDRGPFIAGRCLDLSRAAMQAIGGTGAGVITVKWEVV